MSVINSSTTITLFSEPGGYRQKPFTFMMSVVMHVGVFGLVSYVLLHTPKIVDPSLSERYSLRLLKLQMAAAVLNRHVDNPVANPSPPSLIKAPRRGEELEKPKIQPPVAQTKPAAQTLIQLKPRVDTPPPDITLPMALLWSQEKLPAKEIMPPVRHPDTVADVHPAPNMPNTESTLADVAIASTALDAMALPIRPSTTSPIAVTGADLEKKVPETASDLLENKALATLMSLSDLRMPAGIVAIPRVNVSGPSTPNSGGKTGSAMGGNPGAGTGSGQPSIRRVILPQDGKFTMVLVGNSIEEQYPETSGMWSGRLAYTVYLHLGLAKSWIMQYALPRLDASAGTGSSGHLTAPWPTDILVPNLPPGYTNADALIVHGTLNKAGRFENLTVAFPPQFARRQFILDTLQKWVFRPATQNGQIAAVEVLLVIPEQE